jgi:hypothetical protein
MKRLILTGHYSLERTDLADVVIPFTCFRFVWGPLPSPDEWWGGTELTNDNLWRWDAANRALIAP